MLIQISLDSRSWDLLLRTRNRYDNIMAVGDLNCDLSVPEKHDKQERTQELPLPRFKTFWDGIFVEIL